MKKLFLISIMALAAIASQQQSAAAQSVASANNDDLEREISDLRAQLAKVRKDLDEVLALAPIKALIEQNRPINVTMDVSSEPTVGSPNSPLTIVEFADYQCPYCGRHARDTYPTLKQKYVDTGKLKYVFVDFPLPIHPQAEKAAEAAHCAEEQGHFWEMHKELFANQDKLAASALPGHAAAIGIDEAQFSECLNSDRYAAKVQAGKKEGEMLHIRGTPSFGLGYTTKDGKSVHVVRLIRGAQPLAVFEKGIEELLKASAGSD